MIENPDNKKGVISFLREQKFSHSMDSKAKNHSNHPVYADVIEHCGVPHEK